MTRAQLQRIVDVSVDALRPYCEPDVARERSNNYAQALACGVVTDVDELHTVAAGVLITRGSEVRDLWRAAMAVARATHAVLVPAAESAEVRS